MTDTFNNLIDGQWKPSASGTTMGDENPAVRGSVLGLFQSSAVEDVREAISAAAGAFRSWRRTTVPQRQQHIANFLGLLKNAREELARIVTSENGKTIREARAEVDSALIEGQYHLESVSSFLGYATPPLSASIDTSVRYQPLGVVGIISPWNFPMNVMCRKTLPALLAGNTVVFKPASFTPWSGVYMARLLEQVGLPRGVFNCVTGSGSTLGEALVTDSRVRAVSFTGSTEVGRTIQAKAAANLTRTQLELGGKNALIVMDDADLAGAVDATMLAGFSNAGQWCTSTSRVVLHRSIARPFLETLVARCERLSVGDGLLETTDMGPVAGEKQYRDVSSAVQKALDEGATCATGGPAAALERSKGYFLRPTVFVNVTPGMSVWREEVFGPVLAVREFDTIDDAIEIANDSEYGLSSSVFTRNPDHAKTYIEGIEAGLAHVNVHTGYKEPSLPFGGMKLSGAGLPENGRTGLEFFLDQKAVYVRE
jgi:aldehyde dehydrogenase (NAD+)